jgi:hypothetical protein
MGLFDSLVKMLAGSGSKKKAKKPQKITRNAVKRVAKTNKPKTYMIGDDVLYNDNTNVLKGMQFVATMMLRTPLNVLEHHGETFEGPVSNAPIYGTQADGIWVPKVKTWREMGIDMDELPPSVMASEIGPIPENGGDYLLFLKDFRRIVESSDSVESKIERINNLPKQNPAYSSYIGDSTFAEIWFGRHISCVPGIGRKTQETLKAAGINNIDDLKKATDEKLLKINGIGPSCLAKIREYLKTI